MWLLAYSELQFPHQLAHSNEDAWARGLQVNLLSANTHSAKGRRSGSGIYSSGGHLAYYHNVSQSSGGQLLVADLNIKPSKVLSLQVRAARRYLNLSPSDGDRLGPARRQQC